MMNGKDQVYQALRALDIEFEVYEHEAAPTVAHVAALDAYGSMKGRHCKNLLLRNSKGDVTILLVAGYDQEVKLPALAKSQGTTRLSFASAERMEALLNLTPGSVSPFGLLNDGGRAVRLWLDQGLQAYEWIHFHPNDNTATVALRFEDFLRFLAEYQIAWRFVDLGE